MGTAQTAEESARSILAILRDRNVKPGESLRAGPVNRDFISNGGAALDFDAGLEYAAEMGWLLVVGAVIRLTDRGVAQMMP
jgi:hypothetical protein